MKAAWWFIGLVGALALGTWFVAWWMVPLLGALWGYLRRDDAATPLAAGLAGMIAWGALLIIAAAGAPRGSVMHAVGSAMRVGPGALVALTVAFAGLLAAAAAGTVVALTGGSHRTRPQGASDGRG